MRSIFIQPDVIPIRSSLYVDSKGLFETVKTLHESRDYRMRQTVQRIRDSFEGKELDSINWIAGVDNVADALIKKIHNFKKSST